MSTWTGLADAYAESFGTLCNGTVDHLLALTSGTSGTSGASHLDVGSGAGELAARAAASGRTVVATDADRDMVALSDAAVPGRALRAALPSLPFADGCFDAVTANFVINHVPDPRAGMRELARLTRPGGRVAVTIWPAQAGGWGELVSDAFATAGVAPLHGERLDPVLDFERSPDGLHRLADAARLGVIRAEERHWTWTIAADALWRGIAAGVTTAGRTFRAQAPEVQDAVERAFRDGARARSTHGTLRMSATACCLVAEA